MDVLNPSLHALLAQALWQRLWGVRIAFFHKCALYYAGIVGPEIFIPWKGWPDKP